jgi:hypothetical protein
MYKCSFELNNKPMSAFKIGSLSFAAFSGRGRHINRRISACHVGFGPIPPGTYYIFDRQSGGLFGALYDMFSERSDWFSLYAIDGKIDDETYCNKVKRGLFRLHPGSASQGCITIKDSRDYQHLRAILKRSAPMEIPGSTLLAYGKVLVT